MWTARARDQSLNLFDPIEYTTATLVENYGLPDMLSLTGNVHDLRPGIGPNAGVVLYDDSGARRFNGFLTSAERLGNGTANLIYASDDANLWQRIVWPSYNAAWTAQTAAYDVQTGPAETRLLTYINRNLGPIAYTPSPFSVTTTRQVLHTRIPTSQGRGPVAKTSARFNVLGELVSQLAESASLRVQIVLNYDGFTPWLDVTVTEVPDLSSWARFGTPEASGPGVLGADWRYKYEQPKVTTVLSAAGGEGKDRLLNSLTDLDRNNLWGRRIEQFIDQRNIGSQIGAREELKKATGARDVALKARNGQLRMRNLAQNAKDQAQAALDANPGNAAATTRRDAAVDALNEAISDYNQANTEYNQTVTDYNAAVTALQAAIASDTSEINQALADAMAEAVGLTEISAPLGESDLNVGGTGGTAGVDVPLGARVSVVLDGETVTERIRQITTTISAQSGQETVHVEPVIGTPDAGLASPTQRRLAAAFRRISSVERNQ